MNKTSAICGAMICLFMGSAVASPTPGQDRGQARMSEFAASRPPIGYVQFCRRQPADCRVAAIGSQRETLTPERWRELVAINNHVNAAIEPVTDMELYGVAEHWTYPVDKGDCEDYVLLKRKLLIERGWSAASLLITVVRDERGDGHAVLTAVTSEGDLVLDNQHAEIRAWSDTPYQYLKRQSKTDPSRWVSLMDDAPQGQVPVAGMPAR